MAVGIAVHINAIRVEGFGRSQCLEGVEHREEKGHVCRARGELDVCEVLEAVDEFTRAALAWDSAEVEGLEALERERDRRKEMFVFSRTERLRIFAKSVRSAKQDGWIGGGKREGAEAGYVLNGVSRCLSPGPWLEGSLRKTTFCDWMR